MHILSNQHSRSFFIHFNLIISLFSHIIITSSLWDSSFNSILRQQTAQCVCSRCISFGSRPPLVRSWGRLRRSQGKSLQESNQELTRFKISLTAKILGDALDWIKKWPPKSAFRRLFLETKLLLVPIMSASAKKLRGRAQGLGMRTGDHLQSASDPMRGPCGSSRETGKDPNQGKAPQRD